VTLREQLQADLTVAMKAGDTLKRDVLRMASSAAYNAEKAQREPLTEEQFTAVIAREVKTRRESVEAFRAGGREDLASKEEAEIAILTGYLPEQLSDETVAGLVREAIEATGAVGPHDMGRVMGWLSSRTRGRADGRRVAQLVSEALSAR
jgi:uncharacterized protein YqeY